jgi:hypothetical protein
MSNPSHYDTNSTNQLVDPINHICWLLASDLTHNDYNPNVVFNQELQLLERSILTTGWVQPILISKDKIIIDGFHRYMLAKESKLLLARYSGKVPCAILHVEPWQAMVMTIRMNRAKGTHVAVRMSSIIKKLIDVYHLSPEQIAKEIGGDRAEVDLLYQDSIFKHRNLANYKYSHAWIPGETTLGDKLSNIPDSSQPRANVIQHGGAAPGKTPKKTGTKAS